MNKLTPSLYDSAEEHGIVLSSNRVVEMFQPVTFGKLGYPTRIRHDAELEKFVDVMHENRFAPVFNQILQGITPEEFDCLQRLYGVLADFTETELGKPLIARSAPLQGLNILRHLKFIYGNARPRIFEFGPGCGYLGGLLQLDGYPYAAMDVTQAFYLYQNRFWNFLTAGNMLEGALHPLNKDLLTNIQPGNAVHVPWWEFAKLRPEQAPSFDVVTCNHALCEMHDDALKFALLMARSFLAGSPDQLKLFVFEGWGFSSLEDQGRANRRFHEYGFRMVHYDPEITVFALENSFAARGCEMFPKTFATNQLVMTPQGPALQQVPQQTFIPQYCAPEASEVSARIRHLKEASRTDRVIPIEQLNAIFTLILGKESHLTPDEEFWNLIGYDHPIGLPPA